MCIIISMKFVVEMHRFSFFLSPGVFAVLELNSKQPTRPSTMNIREHLLATLKRVRTSLLRSNE